MTNLAKILTKKFLIKEYVKNRKTMQQIADMLGCSTTPVRDALKKYNIKIRSIREAQQLKSKYNKVLTKLFLIREYSKNKKSIYEIAKMIGCHGQTILNYLNKYNIPVRTRSEMTKGKHNPNYGNHKFAGENNWNWKDGRTLKQHYCKEKDCNNEISTNAALYGKGRCAACAKKGKLSGNWNGGTANNPYPKKFDKTIKTKIRKRDNYTCKLCGTKELNYFQKLTIHHINYNKNNCKENNLISLCSKCNSKVNFDRKYWTEIFQEKLNKGIRKIAFDLDNVLCTAIRSSATPEDILKVKPYKKMIEVLNKLRKKGHKIIIYTARRSNFCKKETIEWLKKHNVNYNRIVFNKVRYSVLIDDRNISPLRSNLTLGFIECKMEQIQNNIKKHTYKPKKK